MHGECAWKLNDCGSVSVSESTIVRRLCAVLCDCALVSTVTMQWSNSVQTVCAVSTVIALCMAVYNDKSTGNRIQRRPADGTLLHYIVLTVAVDTGMCASFLHMHMHCHTVYRC